MTSEDISAIKARLGSISNTVLDGLPRAVRVLVTTDIQALISEVEAVINDHNN